jgi:hypothetical protein
MRFKAIAIAILFAAPGGAPAAIQSKVFDFTNKPTQQGLQEIATILRTVGDIKQLSIESAASTLTVNGTTDELAMTGWIVHQLDQPVPADLSVPQPAAGSTQQYLVAGKSDDVVRIFHLTTVAPSPAQPIQEILTTLRTVANIQKVFNYSALADLAVRGPAEQIAFSEFLINSFDVKPDSETASAEFQFQPPGMGSSVARVFYLSRPSSPQHIQELLTNLRIVIGVQNVFTYTPIPALAIRGTARELAAAEFLIQSLDIPKAPKTGDAANVREFLMPANTREAASVIHVLYLNQPTTTQQIQEMLGILRTVLGIQKTFNNSQPAALIVRGPADQIAMADQMIQQDNKSVHTAKATAQ